MNKKKVVLIITSVILLLAALAGWCYWTAGHTIPMREYQKITERFKPYIVEEIEKSAEFGEAHVRAKLEMTRRNTKVCESSCLQKAGAYTKEMSTESCSSLRSMKTEIGRNPGCTEPTQMSFWMYLTTIFSSI